MPVYVDNFFARANVPNGNHTVRGRWCHMTADTREELDAMADRIGLRRSWIQYPGTWKEHYDVTMRSQTGNDALLTSAFKDKWLTLARTALLAQRQAMRDERHAAVASS